MNQNEAIEIIRNVFGYDTIVLGRSGNTIFWIFSWESEELGYRVYEVER